MNLQYTKKLFYSAFTFLMLGLGISLQIKAGIGQSMFNAFSLTVADLFHFEVGTMLNILNLLFFIIFLTIRRSRIHHRDLIQIGATIIDGYIVNLYVYSILDHFVIQSYFIKVSIFIVGLTCAALSLGAILAMAIIQFPLESLCILLGEKLGEMSVLRMRFDIFFAIGTLTIALITHHSLYIREGTVISFFLLSKLIGVSYYFHKKFIKGVADNV